MITYLDFSNLIDRVRREYKGARWNKGDSLAELVQLLINNRDEFVHAIAAQEDSDWGILDNASIAVLKNANANAHRNPNMLTLIEEMFEAGLAARGKHDDSLELELVQIAGTCINLLRQIQGGVPLSLKTEDIKNS